MNKKTIIRLSFGILILVLLLIAIGVTYYPELQKQQEKKTIDTIKANNTKFIQKALLEFSSEFNIKPSAVAQKTADALNKTEKNPFDKKALPFSFDANCKGASCIEHDDNLRMIILTTYDKKAI